MRWIHDANRSLSRYQVDPARRDGFVAAMHDPIVFSGEKQDRSVFGLYPPRRMQMHLPSGSLDVFL